MTEMINMMEDSMKKYKERMVSLYGENRQITDGNYDKSLAVKCINGTFVGKKTDNVIAYKGIPFVGRQPVGDLRWKPPVDFGPDDGVYEAYYFGKAPCQIDSLAQVSSMYPNGEDCLYLNVWKSEEASAEKKPVMVWIHGGAYEIGGAAEPREECGNFVRENPDMILVSIEYRLGVFGFIHLSHLPDGKEYPDAQNLGMMDQVMALKWIHENIEAFGGDPDNVTIFGQSAGGGSVTLLPLIEGAKAYFKRVIAQSGSPALVRSTEEAIACTDALMEALGCKTVADLDNVDVETLIDTADELISMNMAPERDGNYLPLETFDAYANGAVKDIDILQGCTKDEFNYFLLEVGEELCAEWLASLKENKLSQLTEEEKELVQSFCNDIEGKSYEPDLQLYSQIWFNAPLFRTAELHTMAGGKTYCYYITVESSVPLVKSGHAIELSTVFNHPEETYVTGRMFDETFQKTMRKMWVQFAKTGNPSLPAEISPDGVAKEWPLYDTENKYVMVFDEFDIHPEKESERKIVDWDRTYFMTKYYVL